MYSSYCMGGYQVYGLTGNDTSWLGTNVLEERSTSFFIANKKKSRRFSEVFLLFPTASVTLLQMLLLLSVTLLQMILLLSVTLLQMILLLSVTLLQMILLLSVTLLQMLLLLSVTLLQMILLYLSSCYK